MDPIFEARSVAVYGASRDERKLGHILLCNALTGGFEGRVVAVNPARAGCRAAIVLASGFGETGAEGRAAEARLARIASATGMRLVGPNCMGVASRLAQRMAERKLFLAAA